MAQKVYQGNDPYVFVSYSHKDRELVFSIINDLMLCSCNIWYDTGIRSGEDWGKEIAEHLFNAECVLFMVTSNSVSSEYVKDELSFAKSKNKKIYPVYLEDTKLPLELEFLLGRAQAVGINDEDIDNSRFKLREKLKNNLPSTVFQALSDPFYAGERNRFYLKNTSYTFPDDAYFAGEEHNSFEISVVDEQTGQATSVYRYQSRPAYDMTYSLNKVSVFDDPYFCNDDSKILFLSMMLSFSGRYPVSWPDLDVVLTLGISRLETPMPRVCLIDYKCLAPCRDRDELFIDSLMHEIEQSFFKDKK